MHTVCASAVISPLRQWLDSYGKTRLKMWHTFKHFIHMQYFLLPTNLVIVFVHWVSTRVLYEPRQCSLFWNCIPESKLCFCLNLCRPPGTYSIRPIQKLLNCQWRDKAKGRTRGARGATPGINPDGEQPKNSAMALSSRNNMISIHQRHHVHDVHWTGEFATIIWRIHCFRVSFRGDVRGESGPW